MIKSFRKDLYLLFFLGMSTVLTIELWLIDIPEIFHGGALIGKIILHLSYAIMAAIVFYFFGMHLDIQRKRGIIIALFKTYLLELKNLRAQLLDEMHFVAAVHGSYQWPDTVDGGAMTNYYPNSVEIKSLTRNIPLKKTRSNSSDWLERLHVLGTKVIPLCESILKLDSNLNANEISLIAELRSCKLFSKMEYYKIQKELGQNISNENISFINAYIEEYLLICERIELTILNKI